MNLFKYFIIFYGFVYAFGLRFINHSNHLVQLIGAAYFMSIFIFIPMLILSVVLKYFPNL